MRTFGSAGQAVREVFGRTTPSVEPLSRFAGHPAEGTWSLRIADTRTGGDAGRVGSWTLLIEPEAPPAGPLLDKLLQELVRTSRTKYEAGTKPQSDVLSAETDASKLEESRYDVIRQISDAQSQLNVLMNRPAQSPLPKPESLGFPAVHFELAHVQALALANRPEVLSAARKIDAANARLEAAKREWIPEPSLRVEANRYNDSSPAISEVMAGISINIPWLHPRKYRAAIEEANQMKISAEYELEAARSETLGEVRDALAKAETYHHHVELFRDRILTLARQSAAATRLAYETDRTSFLNLIDAQRTLQEVEGMYWSHLAEYLSALAELESVIGVPPATALQVEHEAHQ
jgi:outer membrane protein TolC